MTLRALSEEYKASAQQISERIRRLTEAERAQKDPVEAERLRRRVAELRPLLTQVNELAVLTYHYYDRGYHKNGKYAL